MKSSGGQPSMVRSAYGRNSWADDAENRGQQHPGRQVRGGNFVPGRRTDDRVRQRYGGQRGGPRGGQRGDRRHGGNRPDPRDVTAPPLEKCEPLLISANRWKPRSVKALATGEAFAASQDRISYAGEVSENKVASRPLPEIDVAVAKAKSILNKLTPEKFQTLSERFVTIGFATPDTLQAIIGVVVAKAQIDVHFSSMYADLCMKLARVQLPDLAPGCDAGKLFRKLLLVEAGKSFAPGARQVDPSSLEGLSDEDRDLAVLKNKRAYLGHIRFIGELYLRDLVPNKIIVVCIRTLFGEEYLRADEEDVECLIKLLSTVGKRLDRPPMASSTSGSKKQPIDFRKLLDQYFEPIKQMMVCDFFSQRTRFMLRNLVELRQDGWVPRRVEAKAKKLSEVRDEQSGKKSKKDGTMDAAAAALTEDGWETVSVKAKRTTAAAAVATSQATSGSRTVGGDGNGNAKGGGFAALAGSKKDREKKEKKEKKRLKKEKEAKRAAKEAKRAAKEEKRRLKEAAAAADKAALKCSNAIESNESLPTSAVPPEVPTAMTETTGPRMTGETAERKAKGIAKELFSTGETVEALECIRQEFGEPVGHVSLVLSSLINSALDHSKEKAMDLLGGLWGSLQGAKLITPDQIVSALREAFEFLDDVTIDVPKAPLLLGHLCGKLAVTGALDLAVLPDILSGVCESNANVVSRTATDVAAGL